MNFDSVFVSVGSFQAKNSLKTEVRPTKASQKSTKMTKPYRTALSVAAGAAKLYPSWSHMDPIAPVKVSRLPFGTAFRPFSYPRGGAAAAVGARLVSGNRVKVVYYHF